MKKLFVLLLATLIIFSVGFSADNVSVGSKNFTEEYVLSSMISQLLEANGYDVSENFGMSSFAVRTALTTGQVDMYPEYTGTAWTSYLKKDTVIRDPIELYEEVKKLEKEENNIIWLDRIDFNNTYALAVTQEFANKHNLRTIGDLAKLVNSGDMDLVMGIDFEFYDRPDGFFAMAEEYGMEVDKRDVKTMEIGMTYEAISRGNIQVAMVFATDGKLNKYNLKVLADDKNFFPVYNPCVTVNGEFYAENPEIKEILAPLAKYLNANIMRRLNYLVDAGGEEPEDVAEEYLEGLGLLE